MLCPLWGSMVRVLLITGRCEFGFTSLTPSLTEGGSSHETPHSVVHHVYCGAPYLRGCVRWLRRNGWTRGGFEARARAYDGGGRRWFETRRRWPRNEGRFVWAHRCYSRRRRKHVHLGHGRLLHRTRWRHHSEGGAGWDHHDRGGHRRGWFLRRWRASHQGKAQ